MNSDQTEFVNSLFDRQIDVSQHKWKAEYYNSEVLQAVVDRGNEIQDSATAAKMGWFVAKLADANFDDDDGRDLSCGEAVRDLIVDRCFKYATTPAILKSLGDAIDLIHFNGGEGLFSTPEAVSAIINALDSYGTTPENVQRFGLVIGTMAEHSEGQRLFSTPEAVSSIINALNTYATTPESVQCLVNAIRNIAFNPDGKRVFSSPEFASAIINALNKYGTTSDSVEHIGNAIGTISIKAEGKRLFSTPEAVSAIINALSKYATTPESIIGLAGAITKICRNNPEGQRLFSTPETVSAIVVNLQKYAAAPESVNFLGFVIAAICNTNAEAQRLFSTNEAIAAINRRLKQYSHEPDSIGSLISAVASIAQTVQGSAKELFATEEFASMFRQILENSSKPTTLCTTLIATSYLRDSLLTLDSESSTASIIQNAAHRLFGDAKLQIGEEEAICASLLVSLGDEYAEPVCRREILQGLERFIAEKMKDDNPSKSQVRKGVKEISSRMISRFQKWLKVLIRKHENVGAEEILTEEIVEILFNQQVDEKTFLQKPVNFFESLENVSAEVKTTIAKLFNEETKATDESSILVIQPANISPEFHGVLECLHREFPQAKVFLPTDISYSHGHRYGSGSYGSVVLASIISQQHKHVAAKMFKNREQGIDEAKKHLRLDHPHITKFIGVTIDLQSSSVVLLLELADCDFGRILNSTAPPLSINKIKKFSLQIASALEYLHKNKLRHLDLKPPNVLVFQQGKEVTMKLADFGSILETEKTFTEKQFVAGTGSFLPPEYHAAKAHRENIPVSATFDIFAFGIILMEMLIWDEEIRRKHLKESDDVKEAVKNGERKLLDSEDCCIEDGGWRQDVLTNANGRKFVEICKKCLMIDPTKRISDGKALVSALNDLAEDEEDIRKKHEQVEMLMTFQTMLLRRRFQDEQVPRGAEVAERLAQETTIAINESNQSRSVSTYCVDTGGN